MKSAKISDNKYINLTKKSDFVAGMSDKTQLSVDSYLITENKPKKGAKK